MVNKALPQNEVEKVKEVIGKVNEIIQNKGRIEPDNAVENQLCRIHTLLYMELIKDLIRTAKTLEKIFECSEEEFVSLATNDGKETIDNAEKSLMLNCLMKMVD